MTAQVANLSCDGLVPRLLLEPDTPDQVAAILKKASADNVTVVPYGGGTMLDLGTPIQRADLVISLSRLNRILDYQPANLTVRAQAGLPLAALNQTLAEHGQFLPLDPPCPDRATLGGILATNASGPQRVRYGAARDLLIGIRVALAEGIVVQGGGQVVKNVAGYDLPKLFIGSLGTLGIIVEATFKLAPLPAGTSTVVTRFSAPEQAFAVAARVLQSPLLPTGVEVLDGAASSGFGLGDTCALAVRFAGSRDALARQMGDVLKWSREQGSLDAMTMADDAVLWARLRDFATEHAVVFKAGVLPMQLSEMGQAAETIARKHELGLAWIAHAVGILLLALDGPPEPVLRAAADLSNVAASLRGHLIVQRAPRTLRERLNVWGPVRSDFPVMQKLKQEFDPHGILNPGRFLGGI